MRPPVEERQLGPGELDPVNDDLEWLVAHLAEGGRGSGTGAGQPATAKVAAEDIVRVGAQLLTLVIPPYIHAELRGLRGLFLEIGLDETLLDYPFELMHDNENFLCL